MEPGTPDGDRVLLEAEFGDATRYFVVSTTVTLVCTIVGAALIPIVVPLTWFFRKLEYDRIRCRLTPRALKLDRGVFTRVEQTIPLDKITDLAVRQGPLMRWCGVEAIAVETAGQSGMQGGSLVNLVGMRDARAFRDAVLARRDEIAGGAPEPAAPPAPAGSPDPNATLLEIRDTLLRIEERLGER